MRRATLCATCAFFSLVTPGDAAAAAGGLPMIVVDPGHGGRDSGAMGADGTLEKDVTLAIARRIAAQLAGSRAVAVKLTRDSDRFVTLNNRLKIAREHHAALFVSIHLDSQLAGTARGWTIYGLSEAASTIAAARYARRQSFAPINGDRLLDDDVAALLASVVSTATLNSAIDVAEKLRDNFRGTIALPENGICRADFWVLKSTEIPSLLIELGYISNDVDRAYLRSNAGQERIADAVAASIVHVVGRGGSVGIPTNSRGRRARTVPARVW